MFTVLLSLSLFFSLFPTVLTQSAFSIDTPALTQCQPSQITWTSSNNPPYDLLVVSAQDVCGVALEDLGNHSSLAVTWTVNLSFGTQVVLSLEDAVGNEAWSGVATIGNSNDTSCLDSTTSTPTVSGTFLSVPTSGGTATHTTSSPTSSYAPAGVANAGQSPTSDAISTHPLSAVTLFSFSVLAVLAFAL